MENKIKAALVTGAGSGIGLALVDQLLSLDGIETVYASCRKPNQSVALLARIDKNPQLIPLKMDITSEASIESTLETVRQSGHLDLVINTAGLLHNLDGMRPEKRLADFNAKDLMRAYDVNALGAMRMAVALEPLLKASSAPRFMSLSARVGSIEDNRSGGWYAYRASKAALNMLMKTLALEWSRLRPKIICAALHPGTVSTALSDPFTTGQFNGKLFTPAEAATNLLSVIAGLTPEQSGAFLAWDGQEIPW